uniref:PHD-type domain-containing protein n=1 Tax=Arundo donax TaxID=35708 RepID=A0A0A9CM34_ARUDO
MLSCHISCIEPPLPSIPTGSWYCKNCSTNEPVEGDMVLAHYQSNCLHVNCVACDRLEVCSSPKCEDTPIDNSRAIVISNVDSIEDLELPEIDTVSSCKICGDPEQYDKRFLICGHAHCLYKYYHIRCLKSKQIASDVQRDKPCWYCPSCLCRVCLSDKDDDLTILCDGCDEAYHLYCTTPRRASVPKGRWYCSLCNVERTKDGMRQYERRMLKLHRKDDTKQNRGFEGLDLLLSAAEQLSAD